MAPDQLIPLEELVTLASPPNDRVEIFYDESERLVRFLVHTDKARFLNFLQVMSTGVAFERAFLASYAGAFASIADFRTRFLEYVSKDADRTLSD